MGKDLKGNELGKGFGQRKNGLYFYRFTDRFGKRSSPIYNSDIRQLRQTAKLLMSQDVLHMSSSDPKITLNKLFDSWINIYVKNDLKESTRNSYKYTYKMYIKNSFLGEMPVHKITVLKVKKFFNDIVEQNYSQSVCRTIRSIIISVLDLAVLENIIFRNDVAKLKIKSKKPVKKVEALTVEEEIMFLQEAKHSYHYNLFVLLFNTGIRIGEASALKVSDVDFEKRLLYINKTLYYNPNGLNEDGTRFKVTTPKNGKSRVVPLNNSAINAIKDQLLQLDLIKSGKLHSHAKSYQAVKGYEDNLFIAANGSPLRQSLLTRTLRLIVSRINNKYGEGTMKDFGLHVLRHTFATRCVENNIDLNVVKDYLGHKDIKLTASTYVDSNSNDHNVIMAIDNICEDNWNTQDNGLLS